jgi:hypothetical protein
VLVLRLLLGGLQVGSEARPRLFSSVLNLARCNFLPFSEHKGLGYVDGNAPERFQNWFVSPAVPRPSQADVDIEKKKPPAPTGMLVVGDG